MTLKTFSWNVNGIRACARYGFYDWLQACEGDFIFLQEVRALPSQMQEAWLEPFGYKGVWFPAEKKGYSGVGIYYRKDLFSEAPQTLYGLGVPEFDAEGRVLGLLHNRVLYLSVYFPHSLRPGRLEYKFRFIQALQNFVQNYQKKGYAIVIGADFNIAPDERDVFDPKKVKGMPGFLPEERQWLESFVESGYVDPFRMFEESGGLFTWWSNRPGSRERNRGWRIDYHLISNDLRDAVRSAKIHSDVFGSDHCPVSLELEIT